jgi:Coenzyme PQQ synthesis protein D (PqqD)
MPETTIDLETVYRRTADVVVRQVGNESILVPISHNVGNLDFIYTLSPVAAQIWDLIDGRRSLKQIVDVLCDEYAVDRDRAGADVAELVADLREVSLVLQVT